MGRREIEKKGRLLYLSGKVSLDLETDKRIFFTVQSNENHSVIYDKEKKRWECDCTYFSLKGDECSHIIACKLWYSEHHRDG